MVARILAVLFALFPALAIAQTAANPPVVAVATGTTGAVVATIPAKVGITNWLCGFEVSGSDGTANQRIDPVTVAGISGGSLIYRGIIAWFYAAGVVPPPPFVRTFNPCIPASAPNTAITVTTTADGTATAVNVQAYGFTSF